MNVPSPPGHFTISADASESRDVMFSFIKVDSNWAGSIPILVTNSTCVVSKSGFKGSGGLTNVSKTFYYQHSHTFCFEVANMLILNTFCVRFRNLKQY